MGGSLGPVVQAVPAVQERSIEIQIHREGVRRLLGIGMTTGSRARIRARCCSLKNTDIRGRERRPVGRPHLLPRLLPIAVVRIIVRPANIPAPCASRKSIVIPAARELVTGAVIKKIKTEVWLRGWAGWILRVERRRSAGVGRYWEKVYVRAGAA